VVLDFEGKIIGRGSAGPSSPLRVGFDAAFKELTQAAASGLASAHLKPRQIHAVCAGLAGGAQRDVIRRTLAFLAREFPDALSHVTTDGDVALEAAAGAGKGVVLLAGTGSYAFGRNGAAETARAGGYGRWIGDEGSAYEMGRRALATVARERDEGAPATQLREMILAALGGPTWEQLITRIAQNPDDVFPRLFPVVAAAAQKHDFAARDIVSAAGLQLAAMALIVVRRLGLDKEEFVLAKSGGVFGVSALLDETLNSALAEATPRARISRLEIPPAVGAARLAARLAAEGTPAQTRAAGRGGGES
jgi:N-acetylglucosamine kinase-like BadF-type ATPase